MKKQMKNLIGVVLILLLFTGCADVTNVDDCTTLTHTYGFWAGLWHGFICLFTFIISLFSDKVVIYETANTGGWYNFGFIFGVMIIFGGSSGGASKAKRSRCG